MAEAPSDEAGDDRTERDTETETTPSSAADPVQLEPMRAPPPHTGPDPSTGARPEPPVQRRTVKVHIDSDSPVTLRRATGYAPYQAEMPHGQLVCTDPCDKPVEFLFPGHYFVIDGADLTHSADVSFHWTSENPTVEVRKGDQAAFITGVVFHALGTLGLVGSGVVALGAVLYDESRITEHNPTPNSFDGGLGLGLGITALVGLGFFVAGIPIWMTNDTEITVIDGDQRFEVTAQGVALHF